MYVRVLKPPLFVFNMLDFSWFLIRNLRDTTRRTHRLQ